MQSFSFFVSSQIITFRYTIYLLWHHMINIAPLFSHVHTVGAACERKACDQLAKVVVGCLFSFLSNYFIPLYGDPFIHLFHLCVQNLA